MSGLSAGNAARQWLAGAWLGDGALAPVEEINSQCLDLLCDMAAWPQTAAHLPGVLAAQLPLWQQLTPPARACLAASPYLLADAGFDDEARWQAVGAGMVRDLQRDFAQPAFQGEKVAGFVRRVLMFGWHLARANPQLGRVVLGMSPACANHLCGLGLRELDWIAEHRPGWVRPRWELHPRMWRQLLLAAHEDDPRRLTQAGLRGIQLMAAAVLPAQPREL
jgi:hypothetical protein